MSWLFWRRVDVAMGLVENVAGSTVLDFGCGAGVTFKHLKRMGYAITGLDPYAASLTRIVSQRLDIDSLILESTAELGDLQFDLIIALDVLEHIVELEDTLNVLLKHCRSGTRLVVSGPTENFLYKVGRKLADFSGLYHVTNIYDVEAKIIKAGFKMEQVRTIFPLLPFFRVSMWTTP